MLDLLSDFVRLFTDMVPRPYRMSSTCAGVSTWFGRYSSVKKPGTHFHWPVFQEIQAESVLERNNETSIFSATTTDGGVFQCRIHLRWQVVDVMAFQFAVSCGHSYMEMVSQASAVRRVGSLSREEVLESGAHDLAEDVLADIAEGCDKRGIELHEVNINLFSPAFPLFQTSPLETESDYHAE